MFGLPSGTVTFLFTDMAGSTRLWEERRGEMPAVLARHDEVLRQTVESHHGHVVKSTGDGILAVFARTQDAVDAAAASQLALRSEGLPDVRMALHSGDAVERDGDYFGPTLNRAARLMAIGHGGQVLVSEATRHLVETADFLDLSMHRLRDLSEPEHVFQLVSPELRSEFPALRSVGAFPSNLPVQLTSFVGRDEELAAIAELLHRERLVTVTGVGGVGKTRLALAAAADALEHFVDGVWLVELETVSDEQRVVDVAATALGVQPRSTTPIEAALLNALASRQLLVVLDNCEHLVASCARLLAAVLRAAPGVVVLATSREPLGVSGETVFAVRPMDVDAAVRLFAERAVAADAASGVARGELSHVERVCRELDGIPLAIELAAARLRTLGAAELARRLDQRFRLLTGGRGAVDRHQTLRATIDWSYELLTPIERSVLARMSVFAGSCSLDAGEVVIADDHLDGLDVIDALAGLVDKSLAVVDRTELGVRYRLLETIRAYAAERLVASGDADVVRDRHGEHFRSFARAAARGLFSPDEFAWAARVEPELDNLRAALDWAVEVGDTDTAMSIAASFVRQAYERSHWGTATLAEAALAAPDASTHDLRARVLGEAALAAFRRGDAPLGRARVEAAIEAVRAGARFTAAPWGYAMSHVEWWDDSSQLLALADEGIARAEAAGDAVGAVAMRAGRCVWLSAAGDHAGAAQVAERAVEDAVSLGLPGLLATTHMTRGDVLLEAGDIEGAISSLRRSLEFIAAPAVTTEGASVLATLSLAEALAGNETIAVESLRAALEYTLASHDTSIALLALQGGALVYNALGRYDLTATVHGATDPNLIPNTGRRAIQEAFDTARRHLGETEYERLTREAKSLSHDAISHIVLTWIDEVLSGQ